MEPCPAARAATSSYRRGPGGPTGISRACAGKPRPVIRPRPSQGIRHCRSPRQHPAFCLLATSESHVRAGSANPKRRRGEAAGGQRAQPTLGQKKYRQCKQPGRRLELGAVRVGVGRSRVRHLAGGRARELSYCRTCSTTGWQVR